MPSREVWTGAKSEVAAKLSAVSLMSSVWANSSTCLGVWRPTESTTIS
ncbi:MAG: hypothetical protein ACD_75C02356G0003 [uncultured bacterium]|nr:MAG: hypothetical protein ACD_75C02356G0003 [uncultured bacterium]